MKCPICQEGGGQVRASVRGYRYLECGACNHVYIDFKPGRDHVGKVYDDSYFDGGGAGYDDYLAESGLIEERGHKYAGILETVAEPGSLLDVGCGGGFTARAFRDRGWNVEGLEPNEKMANHARNAVQIPVHSGDLETFSNARQFDAALMVQVAAHFWNVRAAFERLADLTRSGGHLLIETWNHRSWMARFCGAGWHEFSPPSALNCFSRNSLDQIAGEFGFEPIRSKMTFKKIRGSHARSLLKSKAGDSATMRIMALLSRALPQNLRIYYPADDLFWTLYRKTETRET